MKSGQHELGFKRRIASKPHQVREIDINVPVIQPVYILNGLDFDKEICAKAIIIIIFFSDTRHLLH